MKNKLEQYLTKEFHTEYSKILFESCKLHSDFMDENNILLINCSDFPSIKVDLLSPKELSSLIPNKYYREFLRLVLSYRKLFVYLFQDECIFSYLENEEEIFLKKIHEAADDAESYLKAYENGLVKDAYIKSKKTNKPTIILIEEGNISLVSQKEAEEVITKHSTMFGDLNVWIETCVTYNPSQVSFIYISNKEQKFWYDILSEEYEDFLLEKWGMEDYYDE